MWTFGSGPKGQVEAVRQRNGYDLCPACQRVPGSEGREPGKNSVLGSSFLTPGLKQNLPYGPGSPAFSPVSSEASLRQVWPECSLVPHSVSQDHKYKQLCSLSDRDKRPRSRRVCTAEPSQPQHLHHLTVLPCHPLIPSQKGSEEGKEAAHNLYTGSTGHAGENSSAEKGTKCLFWHLYHWPIFHESSDPVHNVSAFNSCPADRQCRQHQKISLSEKAFSWEICHLNSLRLLLYLTALSRPAPIRLTIYTEQSGGAALPQDTEYGGFIPPLNKLKQ